MAAGTAEALLQDTYGIRLLGYLCSIDEGAVAARLEGEISLPPRAEHVLTRELLPVAARVAADAERQPFLRGMNLAQMLGQYHEPSGMSIGNALRSSAGGEIADPPETSDRLEAILLRLAVDQYPALLVNRAEPWHPFGLYLFHRPDTDELERLVVADSDLGKLYPSDEPSGDGKRGFMYTLNRGNSIQSALFAQMAIQPAWDSVNVRVADPSPADLCAELRTHLDLLRRTLRGEQVSVRALTAFTGLTTQGGNAIATPWGTLRPLREHERKLVPPVQEGAVSTTDEQGNQVTVSYGGELVLETTVEYALTVEPIADEPAPRRWPHKSRLSDLLRQTQTVQLGALLAVPRPSSQPVIARPAWTWIEDLLAFGSSISWSDTRSAPGFVPYSLRTEECQEISRFCRLIDRHRPASSDIAIRRVISAAQSRAEPADRLVDSAIAWENLFGTSEGEPRLRISAALAWLLADDAASRAALQLEAKAIYDARSKIVHGASFSDEELPELANRAFGLALDSLRTLFAERQDVLRLAGGAQRSLSLILDQRVDQREGTADENAAH